MAIVTGDIYSNFLIDLKIFCPVKYSDNRTSDNRQQILGAHQLRETFLGLQNAVASADVILPHSFHLAW